VLFRVVRVVKFLTIIIMTAYVELTFINCLAQPCLMLCLGELKWRVQLAAIVLAHFWLAVNKFALVNCVVLSRAAMAGDEP